MKTDSLILGSISLLLLVICGQYANGAAVASDNNKALNDEFQAYITQMNLKISAGAEFIKKLARFEEVKKEIDMHNSNSTNNYKIGLNQFSLMSHEERMTFSQGLDEEMERAELPYVSHYDALAKNAVEEEPQLTSSNEIDWTKKGAVSSVKDQGNCGGCWSFAIAGALEGHDKITNRQRKVVSLSSQQLLDCVSSNNGCRGGAIGRGMRWEQQNGGMTSDKNYGYNAWTGLWCKSRSHEFGHGNNAVKVASNIPSMLKALQKGPVAIGVDASTWHNYHSGIFHCSSNEVNIGHAVLLVGHRYDKDGSHIWKIKNSWRTSWGQSGYMYLRQRTHGDPACGMMTWAYTPFRM
eukprot:Nk52_evm17s2273 gene=Nk52_evmTU17s2273